MATPELRTYNAKRDFRRTPEPRGRPLRVKKSAPRFVVQKHDASHLHYDFRLEVGGVLKSWAVPKGPSLDPKQRRLAVEVEDHPLDYGDFEGTIPEGQYGGGTVMLWDHGTWTPEEDPEKALRKGTLHFRLDGERLKGEFILTRLKRRPKEKRNNWLLIKRSDDAARAGSNDKVVRENVTSVATGRDLDGIAAGNAPKGKAKKAEAPAAIDAQEKDVGEVRLTHLDRILWPAVGLTKSDLADYWRRMATAALPHIAGRPLALVRCPDGVEAQCFFQKHASPGFPRQIRTARVGKEEVLVIEDEDGLVALAQMSVLEIHLWGSHLKTVEKPDQLVFDLDPDEGLKFARVVEGAHAVRKLLGELGLESFCKTTGGKGLHIVVPLTPAAAWAEVKAFAKAVAVHIAQADPDHYVAVASKRARERRVFIDYLRNGRGATAIAPFSPRARPEATVAMPLAWSEVTGALVPRRFTMKTAPARLSPQKANPWAGFFKTDQTISAVARKALKLR